VQLQQVVMNLVLNAGEALVGSDSDTREVWVSTEHRQSGEVLVKVRDSGVGFDPALHDRLFESFHTTKPRGLGMGLSISRQIIESHGGRLWAESVVGRGATFQFQLQVGET
jgi:signal transduction histidine kinase